MKFYLLLALIYLINTLIITTIIDVILMGALHPCLSFGCRIKQFLITKENRMDFQNGNECAAFSSAFVLRHWGIEANGTSLYERISGKRRDGTVYPAGIRRLLSGYGFRTRYCVGTLGALRREVARGNPVIVLLRTYAGKSWLHYVPVIGYDEKYIFIAESFRELVNCDEGCYNRKVTIEEFKRLWNTAGLKMPLYRNTYITAIKTAPEAAENGT